MRIQALQGDGSMVKKREKIFSSRDSVSPQPCTDNKAPSIVPDISCQEAIKLAEQRQSTGELEFGYVFILAAHLFDDRIEHHVQCPKKDGAFHESLRVEIRAVFNDE